MAIKKTELYSSLWASCDALRGGMDASQYKDYVLTLLFVKYVSDKALADRDALIQVPEDGSFSHMLTLRHDKEIGDKINIAIGKLAEKNDLKGVIDVADFNDEDKLGKGKAMIDRLTDLLSIFDGLSLGANRAEGDDLLGDAYEYLMRHFATESGKSKGQFYTPAEVSRILANVVGITPQTMQDATVYDPTCGSGSLLLKVTEQSTNGLSIYGQEMDNATFSLARMNMILHGRETAEIWQDNTLSSPHWKNAKGGLKAFDFAVANPPFSFKSWSTGVETDADQYGRFDYGVPPEKNGDYAFLLHILKSLSSTGKGAVILPHGVLFRGNVEADIRRNLIRQGFIKGIIGLPANLFYGTGIPACILILDKEHASARTGIFMLDGSKGFAKDGNKNRLREQDIHKIVDIFNSQTQIDGFSRMVTVAEIEKNDFNLNLPRYIDSSQKEDIHDLFAHMNGGIPARDVAALEPYWQVFPSLQRTIFRAHKNSGYSELQIAGDDIRQMILANDEFIAFQHQSLARFTDWQQTHRAQMENIEIGQRPKAIIKQLSQDLLHSFTDAPLLDKYDIYQIIMEYWNEYMQDDVFLLVQDGWQVGQSVRQLVPVKNKKDKAEYKEVHDFEFGSGKSKQRFKSDLIPPALVIERFFKAEKQQLETLQSQQDKAAQQVESYVEEHSGEDGLLEEAKTDKGKISAPSLKQRLPKTNDKHERAAIEHALNLLKEEAAAKTKVTQARAALDKQVFEHFPALSIDDIKLLVISDKWSAHLQAAITSEIERISQQLVTRIKQLEERYQQTLPELVEAERELSARVERHLKKIIEKEKGRMENE